MYRTILDDFQEERDDLVSHFIVNRFQGKIQNIQMSFRNVSFSGSFE